MALQRIVFRRRGRRRGKIGDQQIVPAIEKRPSSCMEAL
jgi:hypothetical protein